mgnify:CR=1 FL=1
MSTTIRTCSVEGCVSAVSGHGYCNRHHLRWQRHGDPMHEWDGTQPKRRATSATFYARAKRDGPTSPHADGACWVWTGALDKKGYGTSNVHGESERAHRASWIWTNGSIPDGACVLHKCDNPPCVNPAHLFLGTHADNNKDRAAKGRSFKGYNRPKPPPRSPPRGEDAWHAKLTEAQVREVRVLLAEGRLSMRAIGRTYGIAHESVRKIAKGLSWKHVT